MVCGDILQLHIGSSYGCRVDPDRRAALRQLPKIDEVLKRDDVSALGAPRWAVLEAVRREVDARRRAILDGTSVSADVSFEAIEQLADQLVRPSLRKVINATGVVLHTNMGRAPLAAPVIERIAEVARGYSNLEYDLAVGKRGSRHGHLAALMRAVTGAEDAVAVNNNAGAVMLCLATLAAGKQVIVSRGELIEIGGSFRIPDVMRMSGAELVEVGTTNKTHLKDYETAIGDDTALLLKVHRSNFEVVGFSAEVSVAELVQLGRWANVPTMFDLGSGSLLEAQTSSELGLAPEPSVRAVVRDGVDLVTFSGDKLLGGPQAGIIAGRAEAVAAVRKHPMMRALRPDKLTIAGLEATLSLYRDGRERDIPAVAMLAAELPVLRQRAETMLQQVGDAPSGVVVELVSCESTVGGGAMPTTTLPSWGLGLTPAPATATSLTAIDAALRAGELPVVGRIADDRMILDVRTLVGDAEVAAVVAAVRAL